jgi:hypothetical protein
MGEETGIHSKTISYDHRDEETAARCIKWTKKQKSVLKPLPVTMEAKKPQCNPDIGAKTPKILTDPKTDSSFQIYLPFRENMKVEMSSLGKKF